MSLVEEIESIIYEIAGDTSLFAVNPNSNDKVIILDRDFDQTETSPEAINLLADLRYRLENEGHRCKTETREIQNLGKSINSQNDHPLMTTKTIVIYPTKRFFNYEQRQLVKMTASVAVIIISLLLLFAVPELRQNLRYMYSRTIENVVYLALCIAYFGSVYWLVHHLFK